MRETGYRAAVTCRAGPLPGGGSLTELRRTMIGRRDDVQRFRARLDGVTDTPSRLTEAMQRRRAGVRATV